MEFPLPNSCIFISFEKSLSAGEISFIPKPLSISPEELKALEQNWELQLEQKQTQLLAKGISSHIKKYNEGTDNELALYVNDKRIMWPDKCITLRDFELSNSSLQLMVSEISYPFISALSHPDFRKQISNSELLNLRPPLAICTFSITIDNFLVLTVRGEHTNVYPGRFYGQGGNPSSVQVDLIQHQLDEMNDELLLSADDVDVSTFRFLGLVEDEEDFPRKPDLIGVVNLRIDSDEVRKKFESRNPSDRPADVAGIHFTTLAEKSLFNFLRKENQPADFCPPAFAGLHLVGGNLFGDDWDR